MTILLIEDDEMLMKALSFKLKESGHKVYMAGNGSKAVDIAVDTQIDLIICDLMIPIISGLTFLRLRNKFMSENVPVIAISALDNAEEMLKGLGVDFEAFVRKPIDYDQLLDAIHACRLKIESEKGIDPYKLIEKKPGEGAAEIQN